MAHVEAALLGAYQYLIGAGVVVHVYNVKSPCGDLAREVEHLAARRCVEKRALRGDESVLPHKLAPLKELVRVGGCEECGRCQQPGALPGGLQFGVADVYLVVERERTQLATGRNVERRDRVRVGRSPAGKRVVCAAAEVVDSDEGLEPGRVDEVLVLRILGHGEERELGSGLPHGALGAGRVPDLEGAVVADRGETALTQRAHLVDDAAVAREAPQQLAGFEVAKRKAGVGRAGDRAAVAERVQRGDGGVAVVVAVDGVVLAGVQVPEREVRVEARGERERPGAEEAAGEHGVVVGAGELEGRGDGGHGGGRRG